MTLKDFYPFVRIVSEWCAEQPDLTAFSINVDRSVGFLGICLEWRKGERIYRTHHKFSKLTIDASRDNLCLIDMINVRANQVRTEIFGHGETCHD